MRRPPRRRSSAHRTPRGRTLPVGTVGSWPPRPHPDPSSTPTTSSGSTTCSATRSGCCATPCAAGWATACSRTSRSGSTRATLPSRELAKELGDLGLLGHAPRGLRLRGRQLDRLRRRGAASWSSATAGIRSLVSVQGSLAMFPIWKFGSEEQKQEWLPRMAAGDAIGCFGLTEPDFGSDPANMRTPRQARRRRLGPQRHEDVDHQRRHRRRRGRVGARPTTASAASSCRPTRKGFTTPRHPPQAVAAGVDHLRAVARGRAGCPATRCCPRSRACAGRCRA